jgi:amphi-Trp domain-containing protein
MAEVELKRKIRLSRQEAGERLILLGKALTSGSRSEVDFDGDSISYTVADDLAWEFELEVDGDEIELEIELKWSNAKPAASAPPAARAETPVEAAPVEPAPVEAAKPVSPRKRAKSARRG